MFTYLHGSNCYIGVFCACAEFVKLHEIKYLYKIILQNLKYPKLSNFVLNMQAGLDTNHRLSPFCVKIRSRTLIATLKQ